MTQLSKLTRAAPRRSAKRVGSLGALVFVFAVGAALAGGIAITTDVAPAPAVDSGATERSSNLDYPITVDGLVENGIVPAPYGKPSFPSYEKTSQ